MIPLRAGEAPAEREFATNPFLYLPWKKVYGVGMVVAIEIEGPLSTFAEFTDVTAYKYPTPLWASQSV